MKSFLLSLLIIFSCFTSTFTCEAQLINNNSLVGENSKVTLTALSSGITSSSFNISGELSQVGNIYAVVLANGATAPSAIQIEAGTDASDVTALKFNEKLNTSTYTMAFNNLQSGVNYDIYVVGRVDVTYSAITLVEVLTSQADGLTYLTTYAKSYYDFSQLAGADASLITAVDDQGTVGADLSDASPVRDPVIQFGQFGNSMTKLFKAYANNGLAQDDILLANEYGTNWFKSDFEIIFTTMITDHTDKDFFGVSTSTNIVRFNVTTNAAAAARSLRFEYRYSATTARRYIADTGSFLESNVRTGLRLFRLRCDFTNDVFKLWVDGVEISITSVVDAFNLIDPTKWANATNKFTIGGYNAGGTITRYATAHYMSRFAITPLMSDEEVAVVSEYMTKNL